jgi:hypothetical protein
MMTPVVWLRLEGLILLSLSLLSYWFYGQSWGLFILLLFVPDISMLGYLKDKVWGAWLYNLFHTYLFPALCIVLGWWLENTVLLSIGLIWFAHLGLDRLLGYGLKFVTGFKDTHLGRIGGQ